MYVYFFDLFINIMMQRFSSSTVLTRLKASVYESDELSESVAQSFLDGNLDNDSFVKQFREFRKVYHLRASKLERAQKDNLFVPYQKQYFMQPT